MQMRIVLLTFSIFSNFIYGQELTNAQISKYIYQISSNTKDGKHKLSGFIIENYKGIFTSLHGVVGCSHIIAQDGNSNTYKELEIIMVDIPHDIALLSSDKVNLLDGGLPLNNVPIIQIDEVKIWSYSFGSEVVMDNTIHVRRANPLVKLQLISEINDDVRQMLDKRRSPDLKLDVINLQGGVRPGASGAPITYKGKVIGVGAGEIPRPEGSDFAFGIPFSQIQLSRVTPQIKVKLDQLAHLQTVGLFLYEGEKSKIELDDKTSSEIDEIKFRIGQVDRAFRNANGTDINNEIEQKKGILGLKIEKYFSNTSILSVSLKLGGIISFPPANATDNSVDIGPYGYSVAQLPFNRGYKDPQFINMSLYDLVAAVNKSVKRFTRDDLNNIRQSINSLDVMSEYPDKAITLDWFHRNNNDPPYESWAPLRSAQNKRITDYDTNIKEIMQWVEKVKSQWNEIVNDKIIKTYNEY